jgi:hypothetical protein
MAYSVREFVNPTKSSEKNCNVLSDAAATLDCVRGFFASLVKVQGSSSDRGREPTLLDERGSEAGDALRRTRGMVVGSQRGSEAGVPDDVEAAMRRRHHRTGVGVARLKQLGAEPPLTDAIEPVGAAVVAHLDV